MEASQVFSFISILLEGKAAGGAKDDGSGLGPARTSVCVCVCPSVRGHRVCPSARDPSSSRVTGSSSPR